MYPHLTRRKLQNLGPRAQVRHWNLTSLLVVFFPFKIEVCWYSKKETISFRGWIFRIYVFLHSLTIRIKSKAFFRKSKNLKIATGVLKDTWKYIFHSDRTIYYSNKGVKDSLTKTFATKKSSVLENFNLWLKISLLLNIFLQNWQWYLL